MDLYAPRGSSSIGALIPEQEEPCKDDFPVFVSPTGTTVGYVRLWGEDNRSHLSFFFRYNLCSYCDSDVLAYLLTAM